MKQKNMIGKVKVTAAIAAVLVVWCAWADSAANHWDVGGSFGSFTGAVEKRADGFAATCGGCRLETKITRGVGGVTSRKTTLTNNSSKPVSAHCLLDRFVMDGPDWEVYTQVSCWQQESHGAWQPLNTGVTARDDGHRACDGAAPVMAVWDEVARRGRVFHLLTDAKWIMRAVRVHISGEQMALAVEVGFDPNHLDYQLKPGERVEFPEIIEYEFENKLDLDCHKLHAYWNQRSPARNFSAIYNTWLSRFDRLDLDFLLRQVKCAKEIGFDYFVVDAGWFGPSKGWWGIRGDWEERPDGYLKARLSEVSRAVHEAGMKFGFWLEAEAAPAQTKVAKAHPDWIVKFDGENFLDFRNPDAFAYILETTCALAKKYNAEFLKFDYNQTARIDPSGRDFADYNAAYRRFVRAVRERIPGVYIEGCASGGNMMNLGWADDYDSIWISDNQNAYHSFRIARETMLRLPPRCIERYLTIRRADGLQPNYDGKDSRLFTAGDGTWKRMLSVTMPFLDALSMGGPFAMSCDLTALSPADISHFRDIVAERRGESAFWRNAVGRVIADTPSVTALEYSDAKLIDIRLAVVPNRPMARACTIRPAVDVTADYLVDGQRRSGRDLADNGVVVKVSDDETKFIRLLRRKSRNVVFRDDP